MLLTLPTALLFAAGYLLRWRDIPRYWIWFGYINWCGPGAGLSPLPVHPTTHAHKLYCSLQRVACCAGATSRAFVSGSATSTGAARLLQGQG